MTLAARIELKGPVDLVTEQGHVFTLRPVQRGKGVSVVPKSTRNGSSGRTGSPGAGPRGRPPLPSTVALRRKLDKDAAAGKVHAPAHYVDWLVKQDPDLLRSAAGRAVYRERRAVLEAHPGVEAGPRPSAKAGAKAAKRRSTGAKKSGGGAPPGRPPHPVTLELRKVLAEDAATGGLKDAPQYMEWYLERRPDANPASVRNTVQRELAAAKTK